MKVKALALMLAILVAGSAFALESGPSNPVGFFSITVNRGATNTYNLVSFPTIPATATLTATLANQLPSAPLVGNRTVIEWLSNVDGGYKAATKDNSGNTWSSTAIPPLTTLESRKGYYILLKTSSPQTSYTVVVAGDVRTTNWNMDSIKFGYNMVGSVFAASVPLNSTLLAVAGGSRLQRGNSPLFAAGTADNISYLQPYPASSFITAYVKNDYTFNSSSIPALTTLDPGKGYIILRRSPTGSGVQPRSNFLWPDYPVPANSSSSDVYHPSNGGKSVASAPSSASTSRVVTTAKPVVATPSVTATTTVNTKGASAPTSAPVKAKNAPAAK